MTTLDRTASEGIARVDANKLEQRIRKLIADKCVAQGLTRAELRTPMTRDAAIRRAAELAFGHIVRELRLQRGLSLQDLAQISREEIDYLTRLEQGEAPARRETIFTLATAFNIKVQEFIHSIFSRADMILACLSALTLFGLNELSGNVTLGGERLSADQRRVRR
jgi:transcriptional regulator with XRE-family HTH domain